MTIAFDLWGQRGWPSFDIVGETFHEKQIRAVLGKNFTSGAEVVVVAQLHPEPNNKHDRNAIAVWSGAHHLGYFPREEANRYGAVLSALIGQGWTPQVNARIWASEWDGDRSDRYFNASVRLDLAEPHMLVPANMPPASAHRLLPTGSAIQVSGEEKHLDVLATYLRPEGECWAHVTLHPVVEQLARSTRDVVEVRIGDERVGQLTPKMSAELLPAIHHLQAQGEIAAARAIVKGNRIKTEVVLYVARAHELPESWLGASGPPEPVVVSTAPAVEPRREHAPVPPQPTGIRFTVPPDWPQPPAGWVPPPGWRPDPSWPIAPDGWQWWSPVWD
ncbi:HIRAN domain-containing protein [Asanoa iriomotensis]|uniref:HIRAN domain-containing protein n=1 Tax=Asanoa iriomotensis TaxID=234613 RepID=A0ABQ4C8F7_9ACTN|nr:HIRAN domain-containing protein [Asanoa iriomotensis]GIF59060.1 hypothetical protein Air01nite_51550 [Asanoa iriomotensis]